MYFVLCFLYFERICDSDILLILALSPLWFYYLQDHWCCEQKKCYLIIYEMTFLVVRVLESCSWFHGFEMQLWVCFFLVNWNDSFFSFEELWELPTDALCLSWSRSVQAPVGHLPRDAGCSVSHHPVVPGALEPSSSVNAVAPLTPPEAHWVSPKPFALPIAVCISSSQYMVLLCYHVVPAQNVGHPGPLFPLHSIFYIVSSLGLEVNSCLSLEEVKWGTWVICCFPLVILRSFHPKC